MGRSISKLCVAVTLLGLLLLNCAPAPNGEPSSDLVIFHAGSLSLPFMEIAHVFEEQNPGVRILRESSGSRTAARKITDLNRACDLFASADFAVIDELLIPEYASWNIAFARAEIVLAFRDDLSPKNLPTSENWYTMLQNKQGSLGRADPSSAPCGYRTVQLLKLAELHYAEPGLADAILTGPIQQIRPQVTDLLALLETGAVEYAFVYRAVAVQRDVPFLQLPPEINLGDPALAHHYAHVSTDVSGDAPGKSISLAASPILYGVTIPSDAENPELAQRFLAFLLNEAEGGAILSDYGVEPTGPIPSSTYAAIPDTLNAYALRAAATAGGEG